MMGYPQFFSRFHPDDKLSIMIQNNTFENIQFTEVLGMGTWNTTTIDIQNYGSIIHLHTKDNLDFVVKDNKIRNVVFIAKWSALFVRY